MLLLQTFYEFFHFIERSFSTKTESEVYLTEVMDKALYLVERPTFLAVFLKTSLI